MRHHLSGRQLSRNSSHRHALLRSLSVSLLRHETIRTTIPKAKELRRVVEPLITLGKDDSESNRRLAFSRLRDTEIVAKLFDTIGPRFKARPGGYTRILHMAPRPGDNAPMALMQLVERSAPVAVEAAPEDKKAKKVEALRRSTRPRRRPRPKPRRAAKRPPRKRMLPRPSRRRPPRRLAAWPRRKRLLRRRRNLRSSSTLQ